MPPPRPDLKDARDHENKANSISTTGHTAANKASFTRKAAQRASHIPLHTQASTLVFQSKGCRRFRQQPCIRIPAKADPPSYHSMLIRHRRPLK
mmetsp:Transcript_23767/g.55878  ORF Transcript_23767/g.55878 Transcript_23767/m.55878 type:complete len:94 (-) Transcript_23767:707-988(-)